MLDELSGTPVWDSIRQQSSGNFRIVTSSKQVFLPIKCIETLVEQVAFVVCLAACQRQPLEALSGWETLLVVPFENFPVAQLLCGSRTCGWRVFEQKLRADASSSIKLVHNVFCVFLLIWVFVLLCGWCSESRSPFRPPNCLAVIFKFYIMESTRCGSSRHPVLGKGFD